MGCHLHADPLALLAVVLQCCPSLDWVVRRQGEQRREGVFLTVPKKRGVPTVPNTRAHHISEVLPVSCFQGQVSRMGTCCCFALAVMTASLPALRLLESGECFFWCFPVSPLLREAEGDTAQAWLCFCFP